MIEFFINRPIFAGVIAILTVLVGGISIFVLPISQFPEVVPPQVQVVSSYVGASSEVVAKTVTTPLEKSINGVEGMIYMSSASTNNGDSIITVTFDVGYDLSIAAVDVLNKITPAKPLLPETVLKNGININKVSTNLVLVISLVSPDETYDESFLGNYADIHITDVLNRIPGVGSVNNFGLLQYAIRIWLDPDKLAGMNLDPTDVSNAIQEQNKQAAAGKIGQPPVPPGQVFQYQINTLGRLSQVKQFENIIVKTQPNGALVRIKDLGKVVLGAKSYTNTSRFNGKPTANLGVYQFPGANAIQLSNQVHKTMKELAKRFPPGMTYTIAYDSTEFVKISLIEVVKTLFEAMFLVILVVLIFLQNWRTTLIPLIAIPVSLIGTFALLKIFGFSINTLTLFGMVLAIGLVVDDAIVVVENVQRRIQEGATDIKKTTLAAMKEVRGPIIATTLILMAVFVPVAFIPGMTGRMYNQFALTIAFSVALSGINSLTLSPALCGIMLTKEKERRFFVYRWFNKVFSRFLHWYKTFVGKVIRFWYVILLIFIGLVIATLVVLKTTPTSFLPQEDQGYFFIAMEGPPASSLAKTDETLRKVETILQKTDGVANVISIGGFNIITAIDDPSAGFAVAVLKPWDKRKNVFQIMQQVQQQFNQIKTARIGAVNPPSIPGLGAVGGLEMEIQDYNDLGVQELAKATREFIEEANARPEIKQTFSTFSADIPELYVDLDRDKAKALNVSISDVLDTLQAYLGSLFINDFNKYGQTYQVIIQAKGSARNEINDINKLYVKNTEGGMVPLSALIKVRFEKGPYNVPHYNLYKAALVTGVPEPGYSSGQALKAMVEVANKVLPQGMGYSWTSIVYQQLQAGNLAPLVFALCLVFVFLFLAALYESWSMPFMILLAVPLALLGAGLALMMRNLPIDIYAQIGFILLIGLAAKNAILIVEFAKDKREHGYSIVKSAIVAARLRLRPILMTAFAFIFGVLPMAIATGAGAASRQSIGTTVLGGMLIATLLSLVIVPVFYVIIEKAREKISRKNNKN